MTTPRGTPCRPVRRGLVLPILNPVTTPPRWLRERRRASRVAARPESPAAEVARPVDLDPGRPRSKGPVDWTKFGQGIPTEEWEPFIAALEEVKGRPLTRR